ncbi:MAG: DUF4956 domain-containing protein [Rikenellaceae bacterium]
MIACSACGLSAYTYISNIHIQKYPELMQDLKDRTGFEIKHFEIVEIDYLKDVAIITIYFKTDDNNYTI